MFKELSKLKADVGVFEYLVHGKMNDFVAYEDELVEISS